MEALRHYQAIRNGMELLDESRPGWMDLIDLDRLNIGSEVDCVLGQVYGSYCDGIDVLLPMSPWKSDKYGFSGWGWQEHISLTVRWRRAIALRRRSRG